VDWSRVKNYPRVTSFVKERLPRQARQWSTMKAPSRRPAVRFSGCIANKLASRFARRTWQIRLVKRRKVDSIRVVIISEQEEIAVRREGCSDMKQPAVRERRKAVGDGKSEWSPGKFLRRKRTDKNRNSNERARKNCKRAMAEHGSFPG